MKAILRRETKTLDGMYGKIFDEKGNFLFTCLERLFDGQTKIEPGIHPIVLYKSPRHGIIVPLLDAPEDKGHGYEIDIANYPKELDGCIAVGQGYGYDLKREINMVTNSGVARQKFMDLAIDELLVVEFIA